MKQRQLAIVLSSLKGFEKPRAELEQWETPGELAAKVLFAVLERGDLEGKSVCDLGCGTGVLAIGASLLGASRVVGVDADGEAIKTAGENAKGAGASVEWVCSPVEKFSGGRFDTVIMNPPFGAQKKNADRPFFERACGIAKVVYALSNSETRSFIKLLASALLRKSEVLAELDFPLRARFGFHKKRVVGMRVDLTRIW